MELPSLAWIGIIIGWGCRSHSDSPNGSIDASSAQERELLINSTQRLRVIDGLP